jgi:pullulanase/glycogen debranching enzyme
MTSGYAVWPGQPYPQGATWDGSGVNFALFSEHADKVELCLFDPNLSWNCGAEGPTDNPEILALLMRSRLRPRQADRSREQA